MPTESRAARRRPSVLGYPRAHRLTEPAQFVAALGVKPIVRSATFALHARRDPGRASWRYGLVIAKRLEARAVGRNAIKRAWREALRVLTPALLEGLVAHDLVVRLVGKPPVASRAKLTQFCHEEAAKLLPQLRDKLQLVSSQA